MTNNNMGWIAILIPMVFCIIGIIVFIIGVCGNRSHKKRKERCTECVQGKVLRIQVDRESRSLDDVRTTYLLPVYEYSIKGVRFEKQSHVSIKKGQLHPGQSVVIWYNPLNLDEYYVPAAETKMFRFLIIFGIAYFLCGILFSGLCYYLVHIV